MSDICPRFWYFFVSESVAELMFESKSMYEVLSLAVSESEGKILIMTETVSESESDVVSEVVNRS